jgi:holo-[acyl-carrier protein] synthase
MKPHVGTDIVEIERIKNSIQRYGNSFLEKLFTQNEISYCSKFSDATAHYAGRFAAKEAIAKALGVGFGSEVEWQDIEILNDSKGKPIVSLSSKILQKFSNPNISLSISHEIKFATAVALWIEV